MDSNVSTDTRPSAAFKGETLQIAQENHCQNHLQAAPSCPPSGIHLRCRDKTLEKILAESGQRQCLPATTGQVFSRSSTPPMPPKGHPHDALPLQAASIYPSAEATAIISQATQPKGAAGQCSHGPTTMGRCLPPSEIFSTQFLAAAGPGDTQERRF